MSNEIACKPFFLQISLIYREMFILKKYSVTAEVNTKQCAVFCNFIVEPGFCASVLRLKHIKKNLKRGMYFVYLLGLGLEG